MEEKEVSAAFEKFISEKREKGTIFPKLSDILSQLPNIVVMSTASSELMLERTKREKGTITPPSSKASAPWMVWSVMSRLYNFKQAYLFLKCEDALIKGILKDNVMKIFRDDSEVATIDLNNNKIVLSGPAGKSLKELKIERPMFAKGSDWPWKIVSPDFSYQFPEYFGVIDFIKWLLGDRKKELLTMLSNLDENEKITLLVCKIIREHSLE